jgi:integrase/recombinase XerD
MLTLFRRHMKGCKFTGRKHRSCKCPIAVEGTLRGEFIRKSLDLRNWEAATKVIRDWEVEGTAVSVTVSKAVERFQSDRVALKLSEAMLGKYRRVTDEIKALFGDRPMRSVTTDDIRHMREGWKLAPITTQKRMEMVRKFFKFCVDSDWIDKNPAKGVETPTVIHDPTLPFTDLEMEKIVWAAESIREAHPRIPIETPKKLKALVLLMRYSGVRISDAVMFKRSALLGNKLFLRQEKTKQPVWVPLPDFVIKALMACDEGNDYFFYKQVGTKKSCVKEWCERLRKVYDMAGLPDGHSHRLRDTFAVSLLEKGVPLETVSILLGHQSVAVTQKHYAPWVKSRQTALEDAVKLAWA